MDHLVDLIEKGGPLLYPLFVMLIFGMYIIITKFINLRRTKIISPAVLEEVERLLIEKKTAEAVSFCKQNSTPMTRIALAGIINYERTEAELKEVLEEAGRQELPLIRRHLTLLNTIASGAPLLGLLGTVLGMIGVFAAISQNVTVDLTNLAGGISEALITTAFGLAIALPTMAFYNHFTTRVQSMVIEMEKTSLRMVAVLKRLE